MTGLRYDEFRIDTTFDFRSDTPEGRDPDSHSPKLRSYHRRLWSKPLPNGFIFHLDTSHPRRYLHHKSALGEFFLSSDTVIRTFRNMTAAAAVIDQVPQPDRETFSRSGYTIGAMMAFPGNRINGKQTINQRRGMHPRIADRFDLTLECIRRHYFASPSPLDRTLELYSDFFNLFGDFRGYVEFFHLQDLVTEDLSAVRFFVPFPDFTTPAIPQTLGEYEAYREASLQFVSSRNQRIATWDSDSGAYP